MKLAFSTLGCPDWNLEKIAAAAHDYGYDAIELRAIDGELNLLNRPEFHPGALETTRSWLAEQGLHICCIDTSCRFDSTDAEERRIEVDVAIKHAELARALGAPLIRIFPDKIHSTSTSNDTRDNIAESLRVVAQGSSAEVKIGLETHGDFARSHLATEIIRIADHPRVAVIWDIANSVAAGDTIQEAAREVAPILAHVHLRDARPVDGREHWLPVLAGRGNVSFSEASDALRSIGYDGYVSFEWEKYWHPEIEEPEVALPDFVNAIRKAAGLTESVTQVSRS